MKEVFYFMKKVIEMYKASLKELSVTRNVVFCGLMAALAIVLGMVASISIGQYIRIGFSGLPNRMVDFLFGPVVGCIFWRCARCAEISDETGRSVFFGFTLNAMLSGIIYGSILYRKPIRWKRIILAELLVKLFINCVLNTLWLSMLYGNAFMVLLPPRILKNAIMLPIDSVILYFSLNYIGQAAKQFGFVKNKMAV